MSHFPNHTLGQVQNCFIVQGVEKPNIEQRFIGLLAVFRLHALGQAVDYFFVLFDFELFLDQIRLLNEIVNFVFKVFGNFVLFAHAVEVFESLFLLVVLGFELANY